MPITNNPGQGVMFLRDKQGNDRRPDYSGQVNIGGVEYDISAWRRTSRNGAEYFSLDVREPYNPQNQQQGAPQYQQAPAPAYAPQQRYQPAPQPAPAPAPQYQQAPQPQSAPRQYQPQQAAPAPQQQRYAPAQHYAPAPAPAPAPQPEEPDLPF